jgi:hypothetical protein
MKGAKMPQIGMSLNETLKKAGCTLLSGANPKREGPNEHSAF